MNLASRLESAARSGTVLVSQETYLMLQDYFAFKAAQEIDIKGLGRKVSCHEIDLSDTKKSTVRNFTGTGFELKINSNLLALENIEELKQIVSNLQAVAE